MTSTEPSISIEAVGGVAVVHLASPPVNAINPAFLAEFSEALDEVDRGGFRALLVASDLSVFVAGADLKMLQASEGRLDAHFSADIQALFDRIERMPLPVIAALNGHTLGGGLELALACDMRIAAAGAFKIGFPEVLVGLIPAAGGTQRISRLLGRSRALDLLLQGRSLTPHEAAEWGLVAQIVPPDQLRSHSLALAQQFADGPTRAYAAIKACVHEAVHATIDIGLRREREEAARLFETVDTAEGLRAFVEGRSPGFVGQ